MAGVASPFDASCHDVLAVSVVVRFAFFMYLKLPVLVQCVVSLGFALVACCVALCPPPPTPSPLPRATCLFVCLFFFLFFFLFLLYVFFSTEYSVQCDGCSGGGWVWLIGLVAGLQVWQVVRCST